MTKRSDSLARSSGKIREEMRFRALNDRLRQEKIVNSRVKYKLPTVCLLALSRMDFAELRVGQLATGLLPADVNYITAVTRDSNTSLLTADTSVHLTTVLHRVHRIMEVIQDMDRWTPS